MDRRRLVLVAALAGALLGCTKDNPGRAFGASCESSDICGCFEPGVGDDADCERGETEMVCTMSRCSLPCTYGQTGDLYCRAHFRQSSVCVLDGYCSE
jgi:hypothetical protein